MFGVSYCSLKCWPRQYEVNFVDIWLCSLWNWCRRQYRTISAIFNNFGIRKKWLPRTISRPRFWDKKLLMDFFLQKKLTRSSVTNFFFHFWPVLLVYMIYAKKVSFLGGFSNFKINFWIVIFEIEISWFNFGTEEGIVCNHWYMYIFFFTSASCYIDIHYTIISSLLRGFKGGRGVKLLNLAYWFLFYFIFIFLPGGGCPTQGEFITGLENKMWQFGDIWQDPENTHTHQHTK